MANVAIEALRKFHGTQSVLAALSLHISDGELLVLVGPSGCGKSTLLRCIAGLDAVDGGRILLDGHDVTKLAPRDRDIAMVFQSYALYPHLTVRENLGFALKMRKTPTMEIAARVGEVATLLGLETLLDRKPAQLSGGQRQRVAMGRAVVRRPKVFLFDEPLSNLDAALRGQMRLELMRLHQRLGATMIYVTHDQVEAMTLANRIAVLNQGILQQVGPPTEIYAKPANLFVARFIGMPEMNVIPRQALNAIGIQIALPPEAHTLGVRAEHLQLRRTHKADAAMAQVIMLEQLGFETLVHLQVAAQTLVARVENTQAPSIGEAVQLAVDAAHWHLFDATGLRLRTSLAQAA